MRRHRCGDNFDSQSVWVFLERDYVPAAYFISSSSCQEIDSKRSTMPHSEMKGFKLGTTWHKEIIIKQGSNRTKSKPPFYCDGFSVFGNFQVWTSGFSCRIILTANTGFFRCSKKCLKLSLKQFDLLLDRIEDLGKPQHPKGTFKDVGLWLLVDLLEVLKVHRVRFFKPPQSQHHTNLRWPPPLIKPLIQLYRWANLLQISPIILWRAFILALSNTLFWIWLVSHCTCFFFLFSFYSRFSIWNGLVL